MSSRRILFSITSLICAVVFGLILMNMMATPASSFAPQAQEDKPVEQTRKNIQVLKGLPESQLFPLMNFAATSLGVGCDSCHVKNPGKNPQTGGDNWAWESDDKPKKLIGRRMMKMVLDINRTNFNGETFVTCYTCHRGSTVVTQLPPLPPHQPVSTETALPTAEQIMTKYIAAVGGADAAAKFKTTVMKGTVEFDRDPKERNGQIEVKLKEPDKYLITRTSPQSATTLAVNGTTVWVRSGNNSRSLSGRTLEQSRQAAVVIYAPIKVSEQSAKMKVLGTEKIGDREAYVLALTIDPDTTRRFFFDTQTGLLVRVLTITRSLLAPLPEQIDFEDYRDVDGIKLPFLIRNSDTATYSTSTRRFTEIKHNTTVDDNVFNLTP